MTRISRNCDILHNDGRAVLSALAEHLVVSCYAI